MTELSLRGLLVDAVYNPSTNPRYRGNCLIESLPAPLRPDSVHELFCAAPQFDSADRLLPAHERIQRVFGLAALCVPMDFQCETAIKIDAMIRDGYVDRAPSAGHQNRVAQALYEASVRGDAPHQLLRATPTMLEGLLVGVPGMGKTQTVRRTLYRIPQAIHHKRDGLYQVNYLEAEAPANGASISTTLCELIRQLDSLIPGSNYYYEYAVKGRPSDGKLLINLAYLANRHHLGLVVIDEIQNLNNSVKSEKVTMSHLVAALNIVHVPLLGLGTNSAYDILAADARIARRGVTVALPHWDRLPEYVLDGQPNEWREFMQVLWQFQWVKQFTPLDEWVLRLFYERCQGIMSLATALFAACQMHAIFSGKEKLTAEVIDFVYSTQFKIVHELIEAIASNDQTRIDEFKDLKSVSIRSLEKRWKDSLAASATCQEDSQVESPDSPPVCSPAGDVASPDGKVVTLNGARKARRRRKTETSEPAPLPPDDYRNSLKASPGAAASGTMPGWTEDAGGWSGALDRL